MTAITFEIFLREPLLATSLEGDPNSAVSLPYVPGSLIRGALVAAYLVRRSVEDLATDPEARALFLDGQTRYLNAYPVADGQRTLPTPLSFKREKDTTSPIYDLSVDQPEDEEIAMTRIGESFCRLLDKTAVLIEPQRLVNVHTQREPTKGRAVAGDGAVFRYDALGPHQRFSAVVLCPDQLADALEGLLQEGELLLGGSQNAGYGLVEVQAVKRVDDWRETAVSPADIGRDDTFAVTLLSDAIVRDAHGQTAAYLEADLIGRLLESKVTPVPARTHAGARIVGGFNRKWGLPLPQTPAASAGSVYTFRAQAPIHKETLAGLMEWGIGERRAEGFGRLTINWHADFDEWTPAQPTAQGLLPAHSGQLSKGSHALAQRMASRMLRRKLDAALRRKVSDLPIERAKSIKNAQLSAVRTLVRSAWATGDKKDVEKIRTHLNKMKKAGSDQFDKARVGNESLKAWIEGVLTEDAAATWKRLHGESYRADRLPAVGGVRAAWDTPLAKEYALRLVDGVLSQALAKRRDGNEQKEER